MGNIHPISLRPLDFATEPAGLSIDDRVTQLVLIRERAMLHAIEPALIDCEQASPSLVPMFLNTMTYYMS